MKTLYILRHAEALGAGSDGDIQRKLSDKGLASARALGARMKEKNYVPQAVACSSALRTTQTLEALSESIKIPHMEFDKKIYHATREDLFSLIRDSDDSFESFMIVGHNPVVHELAAMLAAEDSAAHDSLMSGYPPGTLSVFACPVQSWRQIEAGKNALSDLISL